MFNNPESLFYKVKAMDMMFNGLPIDCTKPTLICSLLSQYGNALQTDGPNKYRFSLLGAVRISYTVYSLNTLICIISTLNLKR